MNEMGIDQNTRNYTQHPPSLSLRVFEPRAIPFETGESGKTPLATDRFVAGTGQ
jgi:hypothetical protein